MPVYIAHTYNDGGDIGWEISDKPADLVRVWTDDDGAWGEFADKFGPYWTQIDVSGNPVLHGDRLDWSDLLKEVGLVYDEYTVVADDCAAVLV